MMNRTHSLAALLLMLFALAFGGSAIAADEHGGEAAESETADEHAGDSADSDHEDDGEEADSGDEHAGDSAD